MKLRPFEVSVVMFVTVFLSILSFAQVKRDSVFNQEAGARYWVQPDIVYAVGNNTQLKLDVWYPNENKTATPTLIYIHGGGWIFGTKESSVLNFLPYLEKGWRVVNVEYRMASNTLAPAAVEDTRCALRWVVRNAKQYNFDLNKIVLTGHSAGGHLSLITGMLPKGARLDNQCYGDEDLKVAAIVNWFGITDVNDLIAGPNVKNYAKMWMGSSTEPDLLAKTVSPLTYVRPGLPPIITIHGDRDDVVPYSQAVRLHLALEKVSVPNKLVTISGGGHGQFAQADYERSFSEVWKFLSDQGIKP